jgi:hypothetical protein
MDAHLLDGVGVVGPGEGEVLERACQAPVRRRVGDRGPVVTPGFQGHQDPGANIITRCAGTKSHTYDESWHMIECHNFTI